MQLDFLLVSCLDLSAEGAPATSGPEWGFVCLNPRLCVGCSRAGRPALAPRHRCPLLVCVHFPPELWTHPSGARDAGGVFMGPDFTCPSLSRQHVNISGVFFFLVVWLRGTF